jgi:hypothetical protein
MRVFLRNTKTRLYCADSNGWAAAAGQALDFTSVPHAARVALDESLPEIEIVVWYDSLAAEVVVPLLPEWCDFDQSDSAAA